MVHDGPDDALPSASPQPSASSVSDVALKDPTFGAYVFFSRHLPKGSERDSREDFVALLGRARDTLRLEHRAESQYLSPDEISLFEIHRSDPTRRTLINLFRETPHEANQALGFTFLDSLIAQIMAGHIGVRSAGTVITECRAFVDDVVNARMLNVTSEAHWGGRLVLWGVVAGHDGDACAEGSLISALHGDNDTALRLEHGHLASLQLGDTQGFLVLSKDTPDAERWANELLFGHTPASPPPLLLLELARAKFEREYQLYDEVKPQLERTGRQVDRRLNWLIDAQTTYGDRLAVVGSRESAELIEKLSASTTAYADFGRALTRIEELKTTLRINCANYESLMNTIATTAGTDRLLRPQLDRMRQILTQLEYDSSYFDAILKRGQTIIDAASARMDILHGAQEKEAVAFQGIQTSALGSITVALAALQVLPALKDAFGPRPWFIAGVILALMTATFALSQVVFNWRRVKTPADHASSGLTLGLLLSLTLLWNWGARPAAASVLAAMSVLILGTVFGYACSIFVEERSRRRVDAARRVGPNLNGRPGDRLLALAREELGDLLADLPPTGIYRIKASESLQEKLTRKGYRDVTQVTDEIGVRYVVSPWEIPRTVERIRSLLPVRDIEYKEGDYKSVHITADLLGAGDDRDVDLTAEIQVRTSLQDKFALFAHDRLYKTGGAKPRLWVKAVCWFLARATDLELLVFRKAMNWPSRENTDADDRR